MERAQLSFLALILAVAGCASDGGDINQPSGRKEPATAVSIVSGAQNLGSGAFAPNPVTVSLATSHVVQWTNNDQQEGSYGTTGTTHNITSNDGSFTAGSVAPGNSVQATFSAPGTYSYHCSIHPTMVGEVSVTP
jgi:plastocyanin